MSNDHKISDSMLSIFDEKYQYHIFIRFNLQKIINDDTYSYLTNNHKKTLEKRLDTITYGLFLYYCSNNEIEHNVIVHNDHNEYLMDVTFCHNNPDFTKALFQQDIIHFLAFFNQNLNFLITYDNVHSWFKQFYLDKTLVHKSTEDVKKMKL